MEATEKKAYDVAAAEWRMFEHMQFDDLAVGGEDQRRWIHWSRRVADSADTMIAEVSAGCGDFQGWRDVDSPEAMHDILAAIVATPDLLRFALECARDDSDCGEGVRAEARRLVMLAQHAED